MSDAFKTKQQFDLGSGKQGSLFSLPALEKQGVGPISRLPICIRIVLESRAAQLRRQEGHARRMCGRWPTGMRRRPQPVEIPFVVARIVLQDFTGVPLLVDLAAMRSAVARLGRDPKMIEPLVPVDLVVDHSVQVDFFGTRAGAAEESRPRVQAQPRALHVPEVGPAGVRDLRRRAARASASCIR